MTILGIQIFGVLFALVMVYLTFLHQKRKEFTVKEYSFWYGAWIAFLLLVLFPRSLDFIIKNVLNVGRRLDFFIIIGFMFLIGIIFHTYTVVRKTQNKIEKVVRKVAIDKVEKK
jgi:hypothetical protein